MLLESERATARKKIANILKQIEAAKRVATQPERQAFLDNSTRAYNAALYLVSYPIAIDTQTERAICCLPEAPECFEPTSLYPMNGARQVREQVVIEMLQTESSGSICRLLATATGRTLALAQAEAERRWPNAKQREAIREAWEIARYL